MKTFISSCLAFFVVLFLAGCVKDHAPSDVISKSGLPIKSDQEVPANNSQATGMANVSYNKTTKMLSFTLTWNNLTGNPTGAHIHGPIGRGANAPVRYDFFPLISQNPSGSYSGSVLVDGTKIDEANLLAGNYYFNFHTVSFPGGEIRGQIEF